MQEVIVIVEGQTEEQFIKRIVAPAFHHLEIFLKPISLDGNVKFDRFKSYATQSFRQNSKVIITTFLDLYALPKTFPAHAEAFNKTDPYQKVECLEKALHTEIVKLSGCRSERFIPHIQPYEFEGLLFSEVRILTQQESAWNKALITLEEIRKKFETPEHINNSFDTAPSKRLAQILKNPHYDKVRHAPSIAAKITLPLIEKECRHFHAWMEKLRKIV